jgi:chromosome segregation ATPase
VLLKSLEVRDFRALREATVTFGPGLNVLFGPNDLGKSTLADALRAAFLLPVGSIEARDLTPWGTDHAPSVVLEFESQDRVWRVTKSFGSGARSSALLQRVGESGSLIEEATGRNVEGRLREILAWGIPAPGGKGAPKGLPESYLTTALLGRQDRVAAILGAALDEDRSASGRQFVADALGALGQDPLVKALLDRLQTIVAEAFTPTGRNKLSGPVAELTRQIDTRQAQVRELDARVQKSQQIERAVKALTERAALATAERDRLRRRLELLHQVADAKQALGQVQATEEAQRALGTAEEEYNSKRQLMEATGVKRAGVETNARSARERLANARGALDMIRHNAEQTQQARRVELLAKLQLGKQRAQSARDAIEAQKQLAVRRRDLARTEEETRIAGEAVVQAQCMADLAELLRQRQAAQALLEAVKEAAAERDRQVAELEAATRSLRDCEATFEQLEREESARKEAIAQVDRDAAQREFRKATMEASLARAEAEERDTLQAIDRARAAIARCDQLGEAEKSLAGCLDQEREVEAALAANASQTQSCETSLPEAPSLRLWPAGIAALGGIALTTVVGAMLGTTALAISTVVTGVAFAAILSIGLIRRKNELREAARRWRTELDELSRARDNLRERRSQIGLQRGMAEMRVHSLRTTDASTVTSDESAAMIEKHRSRLQCCRKEMAQTREELASLDAQPPLGKRAEVATLVSGIEGLKANLIQYRADYNNAGVALARADVTLQAAVAAAAPVDLVSLELRVTDAAAKVDGQSPLEPDQVIESLTRAKEHLANMQVALRLAQQHASDAQARLEELESSLDQPANLVLADAEKRCEEISSTLEELQASTASTVTDAENEVRDATEAVRRCESELKAAIQDYDTAAAACNAACTCRDQAKGKLDSLSNSTTLDGAAAEEALRRATQDFNEHSPGVPVDSEVVTETAKLLAQKAKALEAAEADLHVARGQLAFVGGIVAIERRDQEREALEQFRHAAEEQELEYDAAKLLYDLLQQAEQGYAAHLGRTLAGPVGQMFHELTGGRYAQVGLSPNLSVQNISAQGSEREIANFSVGTRDQLATLIRLVLAAHLKSTLLLDDQLTQSDTCRVKWFRDRLRASVREHGHQIIVITCRALDYVSQEEMPNPDCSSSESSDGKLKVFDLQKLLITRTQ